MLFRFVFREGALAGNAFWATPGGALEEGESYRGAARRELIEETGIVAEIGEVIAQREVVFPVPSGEKVAAVEHFFMVRVADDTVSEDGQSPAEASFIAEYRWWSLSDLKATHETVYPEDLVEIVEQHLN